MALPPRCEAAGRRALLACGTGREAEAQDVVPLAYPACVGEAAKAVLPFAVERAMTYTFKMSEFARMPRPRQTEVLREIVAAARQPPNGELAEMDQEILAFEAAAGMTSGQMLAAIDAQAMEETWDVCRWMMALNRRDRFAQRSSRSR